MNSNFDSNADESSTIETTRGHALPGLSHWSYDFSVKPRLAAIAAATIALLFAACGTNSASPGVAHIGSTSTTNLSAVSQGSTHAGNYAGALKYAQCMRTHGQPNFPDPTLSGTVRYVGQLGTPQFNSANKACEHFLPSGGQASGAQIAAAETAGLKFAHCMRTHGVANFPDPSVWVFNGQAEYSWVTSRSNGYDLAAEPNYARASRICAREPGT
ncbi:MAG: hypothetical protein WB770_05985 [Acidimicrobiales bacterium]